MIRLAARVLVHALCRSLPLLLLGASWLAAGTYQGLPLTYHQPDGTPVPVLLYGDEHMAWVETGDGYTLIEDPASRAWCFAAPTAAGPLGSTGVRPDRGSPAALGLARHARDDAATIGARVAASRSAKGFDRMQARWQAKGAIRRAARQAGIRSAPPASTTIGSFTGLVVAVDFSDSAGNDELLRNLPAFLNGDAFSLYGNSGSVKTFYQDASNGKVAFTNQPTTLYVRVPHTKAYYNYVNGDENAGFRDGGEAGYLLVTDVFTILNGLDDAGRAALGIDYATLSTDDSHGLRAVSIYFAGDNSGVWSKGLWPHCFPSLPASYIIPLAGNGSGKAVNRYQVTNLGDILTVGTFAHECGHMLCDFPDLYNYASSAQEGVGRYCLMDAGSHNNGGLTPARPCAYLRYAAGWEDDHLVDLVGLGQSAVGAQSTAGGAVFLYGKNPSAEVPAGRSSDPTEYFIIENRYNLAPGSIWDRYLPDGGLAIWHVDELSSNTSAAYTTHKECVLVQADGRDDLGHAVNYGDTSDLFRRGLADVFNDTTTPTAAWFSSTPSALSLSQIGPAGSPMTFRFGPAAPQITQQPVSPWRVRLGRPAANAVVALADPAPTYQWQSSLDGATWTSIAGATQATYSQVFAAADIGTAFRCVVTNINGTATSDATVLEEILPPTPPSTAAPTTPVSVPPSSADVAEDRGRCGAGTGLGLLLVGAGLALRRRRRS